MKIKNKAESGRNYIKTNKSYSFNMAFAAYETGK